MILNYGDYKPYTYILEVWMTSNIPGSQDFHSNIEISIE